MLANEFNTAKRESVGGIAKLTSSRSFVLDHPIFGIELTKLSDVEQQGRTEKYKVDYSCDSLHS